MAPWVIRLNRVLKPYRAWPEPEPGSRWGKWVNAIENDAHVQATTSTDDLYLDSYERYAGKCLHPWTSSGLFAVDKELRCLLLTPGLPQRIARIPHSSQTL